MTSLGDTAYVGTLHYNKLEPPILGVAQGLPQVLNTDNTAVAGQEIIMATNGIINTPQVNKAGDTLHIVGRVGVGVDPADPITEDLEVDGNIQVDTSGLGRLVFYDKSAGHENAEFDADTDGGNGGKAIIKVKEDGGTVQTAMTIQNDRVIVFDKIQFRDTTPGDPVIIGQNIDLGALGVESTALGENAGTNNSGLRQVSIGWSAGRNNGGDSSVSIGDGAGTDSVGVGSVQIGLGAGNNGSGGGSIAIGDGAGSSLPSGFSTVAIGLDAGQTTLGSRSVGIGNRALRTSAGNNSIGIGQNAGQTNAGTNSVAIGSNANGNAAGVSSIAIGQNSALSGGGFGYVCIGAATGSLGAGVSSVAIGFGAGASALDDNCIVLNASGLTTNTTAAGQFIVNPIRTNANSLGIADTSLYWNSGTNEVQSVIGKVENYLLTTADQTLTVNSPTVIVCDTNGGDIRIDLPSLATLQNGRVFTITNFGNGTGNVVEIDTDGGDNIEGDNSRIELRSSARGGTGGGGSALTLMKVSNAEWAMIGGYNRTV